jgi:hypothetical protein
MMSLTRSSSLRPRAPPGCENAKSSAEKQRDRQRVPHHQCHGGTGGRREVERAGLDFHADVEVHVGQARQGRFGLAGHGDQSRAHALDQRQDREDLGRGAGIRQRQHHVLAGDHAEVAMARLAGMHVERRRSGARQRGRDLVADVTRLAHPGDDDPPAAAEQDLAGAHEGFVQPLAQARDGLDLQCHGALGRLQPG